MVVITCYAENFLPVAGIEWPLGNSKIVLVAQSGHINIELVLKHAL